MQCKCGGEVRTSQRLVKTSQKVSDWSFGNVKDAPVELHHYRCESCTREARILYSLDGQELFRAGI